MKALLPLLPSFKPPFPRAALAAALAVILAVGTTKLTAADEPAAAAPAAGAAPAADAPKPPPPPGPLNWIFNPPPGEEVLDSKLRDKLLSATGHNLDRANPDLHDKLENVTDPFFIKPPPPPPPPEPVTDPNAQPTGVATPPPPPSITDADRLEQVAASLNATGILVKGQTHILITDKNGSFQVGQSFDVAFPGDPAPSKVLIAEILVNTYSLKLKDTVLPNIKLNTTPPNVSARNAQTAKMNPPPPPPPPAAAPATTTAAAAPDATSSATPPATPPAASPPAPSPSK